MRVVFALLLLSAVPAASAAQTTPETFDACPTAAQDIVRTARAENDLVGVSVAMATGGRLNCAGAVGWADPATGRAMQPTTMMRVGSISKPVTAMAILKLMEAGKLTLDDRLVDHLSHLLPPGGVTDVRWQQVTLRHLLQHSLGWARASGGEPMQNSRAIALALGIRGPVTSSDVARWVFTQSLHFTPGSKAEYTGLAYGFLSLVVEKVSGMPFERYTRETVLEPLGIRTSMRVGRTLIEGQSQPGTASRREAVYHVPSTVTPVPSVYPYVVGNVPRPYGEWYQEGLEGSGGWVATAPALVRLIDGVFGRANLPSIFQPATVAAIQAVPSYEVPSATTYYGLGWQIAKVQAGNRIRFAGGLRGTLAEVYYLPNGRSFAYITNTSADLNEDLLGPLSTRMFELAGLPGATNNLYPNAPYADATAVVPQIRSQMGVVDATTGERGLVPGARVRIRGWRLATGTAHATGAPVATLGGVGVRINGFVASLFSVSPEEIEARVPSPGVVGTATLVVTRDGVAGEPEPVELQASPDTDTDGDGLPTEWETRFGLDPTTGAAVNGADGDPDQDGAINAAELAAGTHPNGTFVRYFAEGATGALFDCVFAIVNPSPTVAHVLLRFAKGDGTTASQSVQVGPTTRATVVARNVTGLAAAEFSTIVESDRAIVVDRTMSWDSTGYGAHAETAVTAPAPTWYLAEGATHSGFDLFYLLQNPAPTARQVRVRYLRPTGAPLEKIYALAPNSRTNIWVDVEEFPGEGAALASTDVSAVIHSLDAVPIIVERAMYRSNQGRVFNAGHESAGVTAPATRWFLAEGATGPYFDLFVLLANPNPTDATAKVTYLLPDGTSYVKSMVVPANSRQNIWVDYDTPDGMSGHPLSDTAVSTTVEVTNAVPIIVERSMWWPGTGDTWHEAHNSAGAIETGTAWALADGEVGGASGHETYILIANTSATVGQARVTLMFEDGTTATRTIPLAPTSRTNIAAAIDFPESIGRRFGTLVESLGASPAALVVERAMYGNASGVTWAAGTNALATRLH